MPWARGHKLETVSATRDFCAGSPHWDSQAVFPGAWGSSEDTTSAPKIGLEAVAGPKSFLALLMNEQSEKRRLETS